VKTVYLALGANLGNREKHLQDALDKISAWMTIERISSIYETHTPRTRELTPSLYLVCSGKTDLTPVNLLRHCRRIEKEFGRNDGLRSHPRPIDIDILLYDHLIELSPALTIPHPRMHERAFVLVPLNEIAPMLVHPRLRATIRQLLADLESTEEVHLFKPFE
jgi:2-amino-4-hydroxy-6-hydroxymethyldihydropteridine diphosphokinase